MEKVVGASQKNVKSTWGGCVDEELGQVENESWDVGDKKDEHCGIWMSSKNTKNDRLGDDGMLWSV